LTRPWLLLICTRFPAWSTADTKVQVDRSSDTRKDDVSGKDNAIRRASSSLAITAL
jgi:hypothetical protein